METTLPSYGEAIANDPWKIICSYLSPLSLCCLCRVNRQLNKTSSPFLWGSPATHFVSKQKQDDPYQRERVYVALNKFKRILPSVRPETRALTHTLQSPPGQAELYQRYGTGWLRDYLNLLPNLQSLLVSRLPLFDHSSLLNLRHGSRNGTGAYPLRLLDASGCQNTTAQGLTAALSQLPHLVYLDLSETLAVRDRTFLATLRLLPEIRVLKLRKTYLRDEDMKIVAEAIQVRIRSLDVRNNHLTDQSVPVLLGNCFSSLGTTLLRPSGEDRHYGQSEDRPWNPDLPYEDKAALDEMQSEAYEDSLFKRLTSSDVKTSTFEATSHLGLTHLRISDNRLSVDGAAALVHSKKLRVLDVGSPSKIEDLNKVRKNAANYLKYPEIQPTALGSSERLIPALEEYGKDITYLRVDHKVVSETAPSHQYLPISFHRLHISPSDSMPEAYGAIRDPDAPPAYSDSFRLTSPPSTSHTSAGKASSSHPNENVDLLNAQRAALRHRDLSYPRGLLPGSLPKLRTLNLTSVPCFELHPHVTSALTSFISDCASEARLANIQAQHLALPLAQQRRKAGQIRQSSQRKNTAHEIFPLRKIVLEMAPPNQVLVGSKLADLGNLRAGKFVNRTKSSTEDEDSEAFWEAAEDDFSFFGSDDGGTRVRKYSGSTATIGGGGGGGSGGFASADDPNPNANARDKPTMLGSVTAAGYKPLQERVMRADELVDVVGEVARFRRERREEWERVRMMGGGFVDGFWEGEIQVVRPFG